MLKGLLTSFQVKWSTSWRWLSTALVKPSLPVNWSKLFPALLPCKESVQLACNKDAIQMVASSIMTTSINKTIFDQVKALFVVWWYKKNKTGENPLNGLFCNVSVYKTWKIKFLCVESSTSVRSFEQWMFYFIPSVCIKKNPFSLTTWGFGELKEIDHWE